VPTLQVSLLESVWAQFCVQSPDCPTVHPSHSLGCHRRRIPDRSVFEHVVAVWSTARAMSRSLPLAAPTAPSATGLTATLDALVLAQHDRLLGLDLATVVVDGCLTKAPGGGEQAGKSPVDRGTAGLKHSPVTDASGVPPHLVSTPANAHDPHLLAPTLAGLATCRPRCRWPLMEVVGAPDPRWLHRDSSGTLCTSRPVDRCRSGTDGWSSAPVPGCTALARCGAVRNAAARSSTSPSGWRPPSSRSASSSPWPGRRIAGRLALPDGACHAPILPGTPSQTGSCHS
jgi:hypothetical protein